MAGVSPRQNLYRVPDKRPSAKIPLPTENFPRALCRGSYSLCLRPEALGKDPVCSSAVCQGARVGSWLFIMLKLTIFR